MDDHHPGSLFQIPRMVRVTGVSGLSAASPVGTATRNGPDLAATHALQRNLGPVTVPTAQVSVCAGVKFKAELFLF